MGQEITVLDTKGGVRASAKYEVNPFLESLVVKTRGKRVTVARGSTLVDMATGEIEGVTEVAQIVEVEKEEFVKLFTKDLALWFDLTRSGMRTFGALLTTVQKSAIGRDMVYLDARSEALKTFGISKTTLYRGLEELIEKGFIARHLSPGWYFINPAMFFNGDRARFVKEYRTKSKHKDQELREQLESRGQQRLLPDENK